MRPITGTDIIDFYTSRMDLLALTSHGEFTHIDRTAVTSTSYDDGRATAYDFVTLDDGSEAQILLERDTITDGDWFPDALNEDRTFNPDTADEMAHIINQDGILPSRLLKAAATGKAAAASTLDLDRALAVAEVAAYAGNQSAAARLLGLDQSTVNKLVKKAQAAATAPAVEVFWSVINGESPTARVVDPGLAGITVPDGILTWAESHGLDIDTPDIWLAVTPTDEAGEVMGEIAYRKGTVPAADADAIRNALDTDE